MEDKLETLDDENTPVWSPNRETCVANRYKTSVVVWHSIKETPPKDGYYIVAIDNTISTVADFKRGEWTILDGYFKHCMTGWTELPKLIN